MRIEELPHGRMDDFRLRARTPVPATWISGAEAHVRFAGGDTGALLEVGPDVIEVEGKGRKDAALLASICTAHLPRLAWLLDAAGPALVVRVHSFLRALSLPSLDIGVDEKILEALAAIDPRLRYPERAMPWLQDQFLLPQEPPGTEVRAFATAQADLGAGAFVLHGRTVQAHVKRSMDAESPDVMRVDRLVRSPAHASSDPLVLVTGGLRFVGATVAVRLAADAAAELSALAESGSFLSAWSRYGELETDMALRRARDAGWIAYDHAESLPGKGYCFTLGSDVNLDSVWRFRKALAEESGLAIEVAPEIPEFLATEMSWSAYKELPRQKEAVRNVTFKAKVRLNDRDRTVELDRQDGSEAMPPPTGVLFVSLYGDRTRLKRREKAMEAVQKGTCPMPQLRRLLEDLPVPAARRGPIPALTPAVKRKVFGDRQPTLTQQEALRVALNTPDVALIQGPPGTGKTTLIVALAERLQELWDASDGVQGRLLLSGFQHDAVENAIQRMTVNGLPPIKFGGRQDGKEDDKVDRKIQEWIDVCVSRIRPRDLPASDSSLRADLEGEIEAYVLAPGTIEQSAGLLARLSGTLHHLLSGGLVDRLRAMERELTEQARRLRAADPDLERMVRMVRALRCDKTSFRDDGPRNAYRLSRELERQGRREPEVWTLLDKAAGWSEPGSLTFLDGLRALRRRLILELLPLDATWRTVPQVRADVLKLLSEAREELDRRHLGSRDAADDVVESFLATLTGDQEAVKQAVISYTSVFAATCQQSARRELFDLKGSAAYDTVVIDEAARANPLDLLIPLAQASRRIVLVGDHRQLPHILDRKLERELDGVAADETPAGQRMEELLKESLFERLFRSLQAREAQDGIRRTVTLDEQYRMHPDLGDFVSGQFYPGNEAFRSPREASEFEHHLLGYPGPAAWLDVPRSLGSEARGQSKSREVEAAAITAELKRLMDSEAGRRLTFGVITFYSAQVEVIAGELEKLGMVFRTEEDVPEVTDEYRNLKLEDDRVVERLRFGTVDAFQGMEFDVVFLSMVRSNDFPNGTEAARRKKYGHLMSPNRLCVAMSRQKRLLVVGGDRAMVEEADAEVAIRPLVRFSRDLCERTDGQCV